MEGGSTPILEGGRELLYNLDTIASYFIPKLDLITLFFSSKIFFVSIMIIYSFRDNLT